MNIDLLEEARRLSLVIGRRVCLRIPSVLAKGERFDLRISVTDLNGMPVEEFPHEIRFEPVAGVEGLPRSCRLPPGESTTLVHGLEAVKTGTAVISASIETSVSGVVPLVRSNPAWVFDEPPYRVYWGDLHVHSGFSNCSAWRCLDPEWCYQYAREITLLDFVAPADHLRGIASDPHRWPKLQELAARYNDPGRFCSFLAFESSHAQGFGGDNNVYFLDDDAPYFWIDRPDMRGSSPEVSLPEMWRQLDGTGKQYITVPHHTGRYGKYRGWDEDYYDLRREPLFEVYSSWGSSEMRWTRFPMSGGNNDAASYYVDALKAGARFGVIASSDDHATLPGSVHHFRVDPFSAPWVDGYAHKGLAAVRCTELTRRSIFEAMQQRDTYATTDARTLLDLRIGDAGMGQEIPSDRALQRERDVQVRFTLDGASAAKVTLVRNGEELDSRRFQGPELGAEAVTCAFKDNDPIDRVAVRGSRFHPEPFVCYYVRIEDRHGAHQWSSPIWVDTP